MKKRVLTAIGCVGLLAVLAAAGFGERKTAEEVREPEPSPASRSLFCWDSDTLSGDDLGSLCTVLDRAGVSEVYHSIPEETLLSGGADEFLSAMGDRGTAVYLLDGDAEWAWESGGESLIYRLDLILEANAALPEEDRIRGLMADVEPYLLEDWDDEEGRADLLDRYAQGVETAYRYAQENGLELLLCVPSFYDSACPELLDRIVSDGCDGIAVMNYDRTDEYGQMADEVDLAREHGKRVICIAELQAPGRHELTEINTYYGVGLRPLLASWEVLADRFDYSGLSFSYHYYAPLLELLEDGSGLSLPESPEA